MNLITRLDSLRDYLRDLREGVTPPSAAEQIDEHLATIDDVCEHLLLEDIALDALKPFAEAYTFWSRQEGGVSDYMEIDDQGKIKMLDLRVAAHVYAQLRKDTTDAG